MKLLIYGAGVIGCLYGILFAKAGYDTTVYARGERLKVLKKHGLQYEDNGEVHTAEIGIVDKLDKCDKYDFIFLTVRENQVYDALKELDANESSTIVTMVNTVEPYETWAELCPRKKIIPAFPGAGGSFENGILKAKLTPKIIQSTTFGKIGEDGTGQLLQLSNIFKESKIPSKIAKDMHCWQICHVAMVVPIADAYYEAQKPDEVWKEKDVMMKIARQMKLNFQTLHGKGVSILPWKLNFLRLLPTWILRKLLAAVFKSDFGDMFMYRHAMKAVDEMRELHLKLYEYLNM